MRVLKLGGVNFATRYLTTDEALVWFTLVLLLLPNQLPSQVDVKHCSWTGVGGGGEEGRGGHLVFEVSWEGRKIEAGDENNMT